MSIEKETEATCAQLQDDEMEVLESIYPNLLSIRSNPLNRPGKIFDLTIHIGLDAPHMVMFPSQNAGTSSSAVPILTISHLPPITVKLALPAVYPIQQPPKIVSLRANIPESDRPTSWLSRTCLIGVESKLRLLWEEDYQLVGEGSGVLWRWWEWLGTGEFLQELSLAKGEHINLSIPPGLTPSTYFSLLKRYDASQIHSSFEKTAFSCSICLENRKGKSCIKMPNCGCIFCTPCLSSCWTLGIEEGTLENVSCPSVTCVKQRATSTNPEQDTDVDLVKEVVGEDLALRWTNLKTKRKAEIDPTYTICPRPTCQAAVPPPALPSAEETAAFTVKTSKAIRLSEVAGSTPIPNANGANGHAEDTAKIPAKDDRWERYRQCPTCHYSFCLYCSATWHGPHTPCAFPQTSLILQEYLSYPEDSPQRRAMEARRGKANLERMLAKWHEDEENRKWLEGRTRPCAGCGVRVEKSHGCNHMTCGRCNAHFCYRCGDSISPQDPYAHYRRPGHACYNKLFDQEEIDRFERETAAGIAGIDLADDAEEWRPVRGVWEW